MTKGALKRLRPATTELSDVVCNAEGMGTCTLSAVVQVVRTDAENIDRVEVLLNNSSSNNYPKERDNSPMRQSDGTWLHTYDWNEMATCGEDYSLQAIAEVFLHTTAASSTVSVGCAAC